MPRTYTKKTDREYQASKPRVLPLRFRPGFLSDLDGRSDLARTLRANYEEIVADVGGAVSHVKGVLAERFVWLTAIVQTLEHQMAKGECDRAETLGRWIQATNALTGLAKVLGIERSRKAMPWATLDPPPEPARKPQGRAKANGQGNGHPEPADAVLSDPGATEGVP